MISLISSTILATTVFLFFFLPGFILLHTLWHGERGPLQASNIYAYLVWGTPVSVIIYSCSIFVYNKIGYWTGGYPPLPLLNIFSGITQFDKDASILYEHKGKIISIFIFVDIIAWFFGQVIGLSILKYKLDLKFKFLKFKNDWFYLLTGRDGITYTPKSFSVRVDLLCQEGNSFSIYSGRVANYKLKDDALDFIYLTSVSKQTTPSPTVFSLPVGLPPLQNSITVVNGSMSVTGSIETDGSIDVSDEITAGSIVAKGTVKAGKKITAGSIKSGLESSVSIGSFAGSLRPNIPGKLMVFKASEIKNINISYVAFED